MWHRSVSPNLARLLDVRAHYFDAEIDEAHYGFAELIEVIAGYLRAKLSDFLF
jgi:hypothetical protein